MEIKEKVRAFVRENFLYSESAPLSDSQSFLDSGLMDSTGILELMGFLERSFDIKILDEEMLPENLDSVDRVAAYLEKKGVR